MLDNKLLSISYPLVKHPLADETPLRKMMYIRLLEYYRKKFVPEDIAAKARLDRFIADFIGEAVNENSDIAQALKDIMQTHFTPFRFFSYRYVFLFDCIFILAPADKALATNICSEMKSTVNQRYHKRLDNIVQEMYDQAFPLLPNSLVTDELRGWWNKAQQYLTSSRKNIVFTATMSAGKSTLINAIIGQKLSPMKEAACTSTLIEFRSAPIYHTKYNIIFGDELHPNLSPESVRKFNQGLEQPCCVIGYFETYTDHRCFSIFDTPGVDSSRNPVHKKITRDALKKQEYDKIVYIISVANYGSDDDFDHLEFIKNHVSYKSILFAINMMDTCDSEDDDITEIIQNVKLHLESIGFEHPSVCPISAKAGLLFKRALAGYDLLENDIKALLAFYTTYTEPYYDLSRFYPQISDAAFYGGDYKLAQIPQDELQRAYLRTGLPQFEAKLLDKNR